MNTDELIEDLRLLSPPNLVVDLAVVAIIAIALAIYYISRRRRLRRMAELAAEPAGVPLWDRALTDLECLAPLLGIQHSRAYAIHSTSILRRYIEARYGFRAPHQATEEFLIAAGESPALPPDHRANLRRFLELCDLLKFGRYLAPGNELAQLHAAAVAFVVASRPVLEAEPSPEGAP